MTLYIECTYTHYTHLNTGIQRVVRNIIKELLPLAEKENITLELIVLEGQQFVRIDRLTPLHVNIKKEMPSKGFKSKLKYVYYEIRKKIASLFSSYAVKDFILAPKYKYGLNYLIDRYITKAFCRPPEPINMQEGDILLLLDSSWHFKIWDEVKRFKKSGAHVVSVVYDLIPMTHPEFCSDSLVYFFNDWFPQAFNISDSFIAISKTVEDDVKTAVAHYNPLGAPGKGYAHFTLGSELNERALSADIPEDIVSVFDTAVNTFLFVSTIEPRKNHAYLLDAFEILWKRGADIQLLFVGRLGWKNEDILQRIYSHPYYNKRLFMFNDLDDSALLYCYRHAHMLLFPSFTEGYGLPIVESLHYGLPVLASDIAVHHEVGQDKIGYFDIGDPSDLASKIISIEKNDVEILAREIDTPTWRESAIQLLHTIQGMQKRSNEK
ncbi:MAG: hypothetical protein B5M52_07590 [Helicobacteraceae bacterium 4484_230]|nr:MAG: hypothetical protein B5M52_07590 [Helicobacteraceae bacterium 4484_230]